MNDIAAADARLASLESLTEQLLARRRLIIASNRGPLEHNIDADGGLTARRGAGGTSSTGCPPSSKAGAWQTQSEGRDSMHGMRVGNGWIATTAAALLLLLPAPAEGETWEAVALGTPGLTLVSLTTVYTTDGVAEALPGTMALVEHASGVYSVTGLPDVAAGAGTVHSLTLIYAGASHVYTWPLSTRTPTQVSTPLSWQVPSDAVELAEGATGPDPELAVRRLPADPTGATVAFKLYTRSGQSRTLAGTASLDSVEAASDGTWTAGLLYSWAAADTATACTGCYGRFTLTLPGGEVLILPPAPQTLRVTIYE